MGHFKRTPGDTPTGLQAVVQHRWEPESVRVGAPPTSYGDSYRRSWREDARATYLQVPTYLVVSGAE